MKVYSPKKRSMKRNLLCFFSLMIMFCMPAIYRLALYGTESYSNILLVAVASIPLALFLTSVRKWWIFVLLSIPLMYFAGNETFVVVVYRHYMKAVNVLSMLITNTTESRSFISNNTLAVCCDVPILRFSVCFVLKSQCRQVRSADNAFYSH